MNTVILHLSDIHIKSNATNPVLDRADAICAAASTLTSQVAAVVVVVTGDIAYSGTQAEYALAASFFADIRKQLQRRLGVSDVHFQLVPGNHDCDFQTATTVRELVMASNTSTKADAAVIDQVAAVQDAYVRFAHEFLTQTDPESGTNRLFRTVTHGVGPARIDLMCLNTAWMSTKKELPAHLFVPQSIIETCSTTLSDAHLVLAMFHHPYNWLQPTNSRAFKNAIESASDIIFTGHEHDPDHYTKRFAPRETTEYVEGGLLQDSDDISASSFNVVAVDMSGQRLKVHRFAWNGRLYSDTSKSREWMPFHRNMRRLRGTFQTTEKFEAHLHEIGIPLLHKAKDLTLEDVYVSPDLKETPITTKTKSSSGSTIRDIPAFVIKEKRIFIIGSDEIGKTTWSFRDLRGPRLAA